MKQVLHGCLLIAIITCNNALMPTLKSDKLISANISSIDESLAGAWQLQPVLASDTSTGRIPMLDFDLGKHRFTGNTGCNTISGNFILQADALHFDEHMIATQMACPGYNEKAFVENLLKTNRYQIKEGVLQLMYNTTILSNWVRHADTSSTRKL